jgi:pyruvate/2-oxoglutarate dehydrogenase complex dihydrolipoamide acyltransferase (E2) component
MSYESEATPFAKKTVYHSMLVSAGTIEVLITGDPQKSKYKRDGADQYFIEFKYNGKPQQYIIENDSIHKKLFGHKGQLVKLSASGTREDADIQIETVAAPASQAASAARAQQPPPSNGGPALSTTTPDDTVKHVKVLLLRAVAARVLCHDAAIIWAEQAQGRHPEDDITDEDVRCVGSSLFIMLDKRGLIDAMPWKLEDKPKPKPEPQKPPPPPPPREPEPDDDEIPF